MKKISERHRENAWKDGLTLLKQGKREGARKLLEEGLQVTNKMVRRVTEVRQCFIVVERCQGV